MSYMTNQTHLSTVYYYHFIQTLLTWQLNQAKQTTYLGLFCDQALFYNTVSTFIRNTVIPLFSLHCWEHASTDIMHTACSWILHWSHFLILL